MSEKSKQNRLQSVPKKGTIVPDMGTTIEETGLLSRLFGKTRQTVLSVLYGRVGEAFYLRQISRITSIRMGALQRELQQLSDIGIISRKVQGRQVYFQANKDCPIFQELKSLIIKTAGINDVLRTALAPLSDRINIAFIYGSFARGEEGRGSDVDIMVVGDVTFGEIVSHHENAQNIIGREINPTVYPLKEFKSKLSTDNNFIKTVQEGPKIFIIGDEHELERLAK